MIVKSVQILLLVANFVAPYIKGTYLFASLHILAIWEVHFIFN